MRRPPGMSRQAADSPDDDLIALAQSIDQTLDDAFAQLAQGNEEEAWALVTAAAAAADALLAAMGAPDADEDDAASGPLGMSMARLQRTYRVQQRTERRRARALRLLES